MPRAGADLGRAAQLAGLTQGPPVDGSASPVGRPEGGERGNWHAGERGRFDDGSWGFDLCRGFAPERRGPFVSAKGPKTIDAPSGLIEEEGREHFEERTNSQGSHKVRWLRRASLLGASRQASNGLPGDLSVSLVAYLKVVGKDVKMNARIRMLGVMCGLEGGD